MFIAYYIFCGKLKIVNQIDVYCRLIYFVAQISYVNYA